MNGNLDPAFCRHGAWLGGPCEDCIIEGDPNAPDPTGILNAGKDPIDWREMGRLKLAELRRWEGTGHPGSKRPVNHHVIAAKRKRERQARKAGRR